MTNTNEVTPADAGMEYACPHRNRIGDNYGESCKDCGEQLSSYGWGGWFGSNLTGSEKCIHLFAPMGEPGSEEICIYCQAFKASEEAQGG